MPGSSLQPGKKYSPFSQRLPVPLPLGSLAPFEPQAAKVTVCTNNTTTNKLRMGVLSQADEAHVHAALEAVAAIAEEAVGVAPRARRIGVDVRARDPRRAERRDQRDAQIDVVLLGAGNDEPGHVAKTLAERRHHLGADLEAARPDRRAERDADVG